MSIFCGPKFHLPDPVDLEKIIQPNQKVTRIRDFQGDPKNCRNSENHSKRSQKTTLPFYKDVLIEIFLCTSVNLKIFSPVNFTNKFEL